MYLLKLFQILFQLYRPNRRYISEANYIDLTEGTGLYRPNKFPL